MATYYVAGFPYSDELYHHGIKGQKWGIRRFQNEDGSYTEAGLKRYGARNDRQANALAKYQEREYGSAKNYYDARETALKNKKDKLTSKINKTTSTDRAGRLGIKLSRTEERLKSIEKNRNNVLRGIKDMKISDMRKEKIIKGSAAATMLLLAVGSVGLGTGTSLSADLYYRRLGDAATKYAINKYVPAGIFAIGGGGGAYASMNTGSVGRAAVRKYREHKYRS